MSERAYQETKTTTDTSLDPVEYAVLSQALMAAGREMGVKLIRSSYSNIVREAQDASAALFDRAGNVVAQAELLPMQLGPMSDIFRAGAAVVPPEDLKEGDFYINNDPYGGGQHLQDVFIFSPIFVSSELVGFAGPVSHHLDLGGGNPGLSPDAVDVHAEGIIFHRPCTTFHGIGTADRWSDWSRPTFVFPIRRSAIFMPSLPPMPSAPSV